MGRNIFKIILYIIAALAAVAVLFLFISYISEYRPKERQEIYTSPLPPPPVPDTLTIVTWNIGYAGLGDNMDFFYDGGRCIRDSKERSGQNLQRIISVLDSLDADIILLQEVDISSRRSYRTNQRKVINEALGTYHDYFALNYRVLFVPIPARSPIGKVKSGMLMLTRYEPVDVVRYDYPSRFRFPERMFNLKRGLLSARFTTQQGDTLMINNTHNTAYDDGEMRTEEMKFLGTLLLEASAKGTRSITGGDWNHYPPGYTPSAEELANEYFRPRPIDKRHFENFADFIFDDSVSSARFLDRPYDPGSITTTLDFFLVSRGLRVLSIKTIDLGFQASDHNPVVMKVTM